MKKIISLILTLVFTAQIGFATESAQSELSYNNDELSKAVYILNDLGILSLQEETGIWQNKSVSRAEFAEMICKAFKLETSSDSVYFVDVPYDMWAFKPVTAMAEMGYISVPEDRKFRPDDTVTYAEALKMILSAANYNIYAEYNGGFPIGYTKAAQRMELGVSAENNTGLTVAAAVTLIYDVMSMGFYEPQAYSDIDAVPYREADKIILAVLWNTYIERGCLEAYYGAGYQATVYDTDDVVIDGTKYKLASEMHLDDYFLNEIEFIYKKTGDEVGSIVYIEDTGSSRDEIIDTVDLSGFESGSYTLSYYKNDKVVQKTLQRGCTVIYNGAVYGGSADEVFKELTSGEKRGTIRLKSRSGGGIDTVIIKAYRNFVAGYADSATSRMYNKFDSSDCIDMTEYTQVVTRSLEGENITLDFSTLPILLSVAEAKDRSALEIVVCREKLTDTIQEINGTGTETYFTIGGNKYKLDYTMYKKQMLDENGNEISSSALLGAEYEFYIDKFGNVAYMNELGAGDGFSIGYVIDGVKNQGVFASELKFKVLTESDGVIEYDAKEKVVIDGVSYKFDNIENALSALEKGAEANNSTADEGHLAPQIIRYKADENNIIKEIDTAYVGESENEDNTLTLIAGDGVNTFSYKVTGGMPKFGQKILFSSSKTKIFSIPLTNDEGELIVNTDPSSVRSGDIVIRVRTTGTPVKTKVLDPSGNVIIPDDSMYQTGAPWGFTSDGSYSVRAYKFNPNTPYCDALVCSYQPYAVPLENVMVEEISDVYSESGEIAKMLTGWQRGKRVSYEIADNSDTSELECGDIVYLWKDSTDKKIAFVKKIYDFSDDKFVNRPYTEASNRIYVDYIWACEWGTISSATGQVSPGYYSYNALSKGLVLEKIADTMRWDWDGNYRTFEETFDFSNIPIVIYDKNAPKNKVYVGSVAEVPDYKSVGENEAARIVINTDRLRGVCAFIYLNY